MNFEIERKFLVRTNDWRKLAIGHATIRQAYLDTNPRVSIRVRIKDNCSAALSIKSQPSSLRRLEVEYPIPILEAEALMPLSQGLIIKKVRYAVPCDPLTWEVDVFSGENEGLVIAEIELPRENYKIELPSWIGREVTGQAQYYNGTLAQRPFSSWIKPTTKVVA